MPDMLKEVGYILCEETMTNVEFKIKDEIKYKIKMTNEIKAPHCKV